MCNRCSWVNLKNPEYIKYHDTEWGVPLHNDRDLFEMLILESFQAGLSWECVLNKRQAFKIAFDNFDVNKVASYSEENLLSLYNDTKIIRNKLKILASVKNANVFKNIKTEFGSFDKYIWSFTNYQTIYEDYNTKTTSSLSDTISNDLKRRGMTFVGSTTIYSYLQAIGIIYAHGKECDLYKGN